MAYFGLVLRYLAFSAVDASDARGQLLLSGVSPVLPVLHRLFHFLYVSEMLHHVAVSL